MPLDVEVHRPRFFREAGPGDEREVPGVVAEDVQRVAEVVPQRLEDSVVHHGDRKAEPPGDLFTPPALARKVRRKDRSGDREEVLLQGGRVPETALKLALSGEQVLRRPEHVVARRVGRVRKGDCDGGHQVPPESAWTTAPT